MAPSQSGCGACMTIGRILVDVVGHLAVCFAAWVTTFYVFPAYFAVHLLFAVLTSKLQAWQVVEEPLMWLFPPSHHVQLVRWGSLGLRVAAVALAYMVAGYFAAVGGCHAQLTTEDCDSLPPWLRSPWWSQEARCMARGAGKYGYNDCLETEPWYKRGKCNWQAGNCNIQNLPVGTWNLATLVMISGVLALPVLLVLNLCSCCWSCCEAQPEASTGQAAAAAGETQASRAEVGAVAKIKYVALTLFPVFLDVLSDLNGILQFVLTGNFAFAAAGAGIFIWSAWQQIRRGAIQKGMQAVVESVSQGDSTELMSLMLLSEKSVEAPLQLMLQFYAFVFVTSSEFAVVSFVASIIMSSISVSQAVHSLIFLGGAEKLMAKEYAPLT